MTSETSQALTVDKWLHLGDGHGWAGCGCRLGLFRFGRITLWLRVSSKAVQRADVECVGGLNSGEVFLRHRDQLYLGGVWLLRSLCFKFLKGDIIDRNDSYTTMTSVEFSARWFFTSETQIFILESVDYRGLTHTDTLATEPTSSLHLLYTFYKLSSIGKQIKVVFTGQRIIIIVFDNSQTETNLNLLRQIRKRLCHVSPSTNSISVHPTTT